jgi:hypothetical protein
MIHNFQFKAQCSPATTSLIEFKPLPVNTTLLIIIILVVILLGGGWYGRGRWF